MSQLVPPSWMEDWISSRGRSSVDTSRVRVVVDAVRHGATVPEATAFTGLERAELFAIVSGVGSRCTQIAKSRAPKYTIEKGLPGQALSSTLRHGVHELVAADGWIGPRKFGDVRKAYAAVCLAHSDVLESAVVRFMAYHEAATPIGYRHFVNLYNSCRGVLPPLSEAVVVGTASDAFLKAWDILDTSVEAAAVSTSALLRTPTPQAAAAASRQAWWLLPQAAVLNRQAMACLEAKTPDGRMHAERALRHSLVGLRAIAEKSPRRLFPRRLEHLTLTQVKALAAYHGYHPEDASAARTDGTYAEVAQAAQEAFSAPGFREVLNVEDLVGAL